MARKLAVILHRIWADGSEFHWGKQALATHRRCMIEGSSSFRLTSVDVASFPWGRWAR